MLSFLIAVFTRSVSVRCCFLFDKSYMKLIIYYLHTQARSQFIRYIQRLLWGYSSLLFKSTNILCACILFYVCTRRLVNCCKNNVSSFWKSFFCFLRRKGDTIFLYSSMAKAWSMVNDQNIRIHYSPETFVYVSG